MARWPTADAHWMKHPRVCRLRDLQQQEYRRPLWELKEFNMHLFHAEITGDGNYVVAEGNQRGPDGAWHRISVREALTGKQLSSHELSMENRAGTMVIDSSGKILSFAPDFPKSLSSRLVQIPSGEYLGSLETAPAAMSPGVRAWATTNDHRIGGVQLYRGKEKTPLATLNIDVPVTSLRHEFEADGSHLAWGNADGTVTICDINEVQRRLAAVGLGW